MKSKLTDTEAEQVGRQLATMLNLKPLTMAEVYRRGLADLDIGRYYISPEWGAKGNRGLYLSVKRMIKQLEDSVIMGRIALDGETRRECPNCGYDNDISEAECIECDSDMGT